MHNIELIKNSQSILAEGPVYNEKENSLYWTDIKDKKIYKYNLIEEKVIKYQFDKKIGTFAFTNKNKIIAACEDGFYYLNLEEETMSFIYNPEEEIPENRFNDGKCDIQGRFYAGTMDDKEEKTCGSLYFYEKNNIRKIESNLGISNGLGWNKSNTKFYLTDSPKREIYEYDYDINTGYISNKKIFAKIKEEDGFPDGLTLDDDDNIYSCHWDGFKITKYSPTGKILEIIKLPVPNISSCCFGGKDFDILFITSARKGLSTEDLKKYPLSGHVFKLKLNVSGQKSNLFIED